MSPFILSLHPKRRQCVCVRTFNDKYIFLARFAQKLPEQYKLLRRKLFRIPQWTSSEEDEGDSDGHEPQTVRPESPPPPPFPEPLVPNHKPTRNLVPSRSRSLSASLEQEADMRRAEPRPRKVLQREVSMSKVFKGPRRNGSNAPPVKVEAEITTMMIAAATSSSTTSTSTTQGPAKRPIVLVEGTPQKPKAKARSKRH